MAKTKSVRVMVDDASVLEQASREIAVKLEREVKVSEVVNALMKYKEQALHDIFQKEVDAINSNV